MVSSSCVTNVNTNFGFQSYLIHVIKLYPTRTLLNSQQPCQRQNYYAMCRLGPQIRSDPLM